jgi:hypothetical protein
LLEGVGRRWLAGDPHAKAYAVLASPLGQRIMDALRKGDEKLPTSATQYDRCLACHTNPTLATPGAFGLAADDLSRVRSEGVACEGCHGNAGPWLADHTAKTAAYPPPGMTNLNNVGERAVTCAGCHVGAPADPARGILVARDMNHDMIAAGHPRLNFEQTEYQWQLPRHWFDRERSAPGRPPRGPGIESTVWLVGRVAVAEAACRLLADRTTRAWPEFAEGNCYACHHSLEPEGWRKDRPAEFYTDRLPGALPWQSVWPLTQKDVADADPRFAPAATALRAVVQAYSGHRPRKVAQDGRPPSYPPPTAAEILPLAKAVADQLAALRAELSRPGTKVAVAPFFPADPKAINRLNWDEAGQLYLGLAATARSLGPPFDDRFGPVRDALLLPRKSNSPDNYSPENVRTGLGGLVAAVRRKADAAPAAGPK